ncbi:MAG: ATP-dependent helicase C-terminal domain-containing protein [Vicinamibacterales bacterium]
MRASTLPVDEHVPGIVDALGRDRAAVVVAAPGAGKTTRIPPALTADGPVILLQPRRVAARAVARYIASERGWTLGREAGWHVKFDRHFSATTRLLVATEGILTARLRQDPLLSDFRTIVIDEFHERSIHADLGLALAKQAWAARSDLRILVMSATLDANAVSRYLGGCRVFDIPGRLHPLSVEYRPGSPVGAAAQELAQLTGGQILCFLPGAGEVRRAAEEVKARVGSRYEVVELHGSLDADDQDRAIAESPRKRIIVATNIAETSLTVAGVTAVIDTGVHKVARYDAHRALDTLEIERISADAAKQRAGRAGRIAPGLVRRLWSESDTLRPHREPDIRRIDLSAPLLDICSWGGDPMTFDWFETPPEGALRAGLELLEALGAVAGGQLTDVGRTMSRLPIHPRLGRILVEPGADRAIARACAILSDRQFLPFHPPATSSDLLSAAEDEARLPAHVRRMAQELERLMTITAGSTVDEARFRRAVFLGYPDRLAHRRATGQSRVLLSNGHGAVVGQESGVRDAEYLVALDIIGGRRGEGAEARIRMASAVEKQWLSPTHVATEHQIDAGSGTLRACERQMYGAIVLGERVVAVDPLRAGPLLAGAFLGLPRTEADEQLIRRLEFAGVALDTRELALRAASEARRLSDIDLFEALDWKVKQALEREAPASIVAPSGRIHLIEYESGGGVSASIKLQELFGLAETPVIGSRRIPLRLHLLAPNGRPVQTTADLRSFWDRTYPEVRKELRGRYPKHPWPDDPWKATPTARTTRRLRS